MQDAVARSFEHAIELLYQGSWNESLKRDRSCYAFRGMPAADYRLATSLLRLDNHHLEHHLIRNFRKYAKLGDADVHFSEWKWVTIGQHHGLPTRLLDWTYSPFVALHFATDRAEHFDKDGVVWCVDFVHCNQATPPILQQQLKTGSAAFTIGMLDQVGKGFEEFDQLSDEPFTLFFEPPSMDERIVNQFALFSVMSDPSAYMDSWLRDRPQFYRRVVIPAARKWEIRDKLDQANITERVLFPGLDGLAKWLARHYAPRT